MELAVAARNRKNYVPDCFGHKHRNRRNDAAAKDGQLAACGMSLLKPVMIDGDFKSSYAYLAKSPFKNIYNLVCMTPRSSFGADRGFWHCPLYSAR